MYLYIIIYNIEFCQQRENFREMPNKQFQLKPLLRFHKTICEANVWVTRRMNFKIALFSNSQYFTYIYFQKINNKFTMKQTLSRVTTMSFTKQIE